MKRENNKQKGITLIALIITIIVMIILVSVTISISLNGGLFDAAKTASEGMQMQNIKEKTQTVIATIIAEDMYGNQDEDIWTYMINRVSNEFEGSKINGNIITTGDDKYDIRINEDYSVDVDKKGTLEDTYIPSYLIEFTNITVNNDNKYINVDFNLVNDDGVFLYEYVVKRKNYTTEEKWSAVKEYYYNEEDTGKDYNSYEEAITDTIINEINNYEFFATNTTEGRLRRRRRSTPCTYTSIDECLQDTSLIALNVKTTDKLYYMYYCYLAAIDYSNDENEVKSLEDLLNFDYADYLMDQVERISLDMKVIEFDPDGSSKEVPVDTYNSKEFFIRSYNFTKKGTYKYIVYLKDVAIGSCTAEVS